MNTIYALGELYGILWAAAGSFGWAMQGVLALVTFIMVLLIVGTMVRVGEWLLR